MSEFIIAKYIRLSVEDSKSDSMSIENQRLMIDKYISGLDAEHVKTIEFIDNGFSGTNFERPAAQKLIELVRAGGVNCVIVKDFSRFGRSAIDVGYFIERVFPLFGVRFISISDNYDSANHAGDTGGLEVALAFLIHEQYSRDLSNKVKAAKREKIRRGESVTKNCLFGYMLNENREIVIDEPAAETVQRIFSLADEGKGVTAIAKILYDEQRPTPGKHSGKTRNNGCLWGVSAISSILKNEQYTGMYVAGKAQILEVGSKKRIGLPEDQWVKIPNHHPAIIDKELFEDVQFLRQQNRVLKTTQSSGSEYRNYNADDPLKGKIVCGCCNHVMCSSNTKNSKYHCKFTLAANDAPCHRLSILGSELRAAVLQQLIVTSIDIAENKNRLSQPSAMRSERQARILNIEGRKRANYEKLILGEIDTEDFRAINNKLDTELTLAKQFISATAQSSAQHIMYDEIRETAQKILDTRELTRQIVETMIDKVRVFPGGEIDIMLSETIKPKIGDEYEEVSL